MNEQQCNTCGSFTDILKCAHCPTAVCVRCKSNHERICSEMQKRKERGEGPTIRNLGTNLPSIPVPPIEAVDQGLAGVKDLLA